LPQIGPCNPLLNSLAGFVSVGQLLEMGSNEELKAFILLACNSGSLTLLNNYYLNKT